MLATGPDGKASIHFDLSDAATTFRVLVDAEGEGRIGFGQAVLVSREPAQPGSKPSSETANASEHVPKPSSEVKDASEQAPKPSSGVKDASATPRAETESSTQTP
jgi:hypothetical protein